MAVEKGFRANEAFPVTLEELLLHSTVTVLEFQQCLKACTQSICLKASVYESICLSYVWKHILGAYEWAMFESISLWSILLCLIEDRTFKEKRGWLSGEGERKRGTTRNVVLAPIYIYITQTAVWSVCAATSRTMWCISELLWWLVVRARWVELWHPCGKGCTMLWIISGPIGL